MQSINIINFDTKSQNIYEKKEYVLLGISPCNGYYTEEKIANLIQWAKVNFQGFYIFLADELSYFNFKGIGYTEEQAICATKKEDRLLLNKTTRALKKIGFSSNKIILHKDLKNQKEYQELYQKYTKALFNNEGLKASVKKNDRRHFILSAKLCGSKF